MTTYESKSELKRLRYLENRAKCVSSFHEFISVKETLHPNLFSGTKIRSIRARKTSRLSIQVKTEKLEEKTGLLMLAKVTDVH